MTYEKFKDEVTTLNSFISIYCKDKHKDQNKTTHSLKFKEETLDVDTELCKECEELIKYSFIKLQNCPHEIKPRCRRCPNSCYDKPQWKKTAKIMRYSGIRLGLLKVKNFLKISS